MSECQRCKSLRILFFTGKSSDLNNYSLGEKQSEMSSYVPSNIEIGGGDYIQLQLCLECGQLQGEWPAEDPEGLISEEEEEDEC